MFKNIQKNVYSYIKRILNDVKIKKNGKGLEIMLEEQREHSWDVEFVACWGKICA